MTPTLLLSPSRRACLRAVWLLGVLLAIPALAGERAGSPLSSSWSAPCPSELPCAGVAGLDINLLGFQILTGSPEAPSGLASRLLSVSSSGAAAGGGGTVARAEGSRLWTWVALGTAGAALVSGVVVGTLARVDQDTLLREKHLQPEVQQLHDGALAKAQAANILYGVGGGLAVVGGVLFLVEGRF